MTITTATPARQRLDFNRLLPEASEAMSALHKAASDRLETRLLDLVCLRTAQVSGCAFCLDVHAKDALHHGDTSDRLFMLDAWREAPGYTARERAALALAEAVTLVSESRVPDDVWEEAAAAFDERELAALLAAIISSNAWNRLGISVRRPAGRYQPR